MLRRNLVVYTLVLLLLGIGLIGTAATQETISSNITVSINDSSNGVDTKNSSITIDTSSTDESTNSSTPTTAEGRVLTILNVNSASQLEQGDVTAMISLFAQDQTRNGLEIKQGDVTAVISLFAQNN